MKKYGLLIFLLLLSACGKRDTSIQKSEISGVDGQQHIGNSVLEAYGEERLLWRLTSETMFKENPRADVIVSPVHLLMYDDSGKVTTVVKADSGSTPQDMQTFYIWGSVNIETEDGKKINSRSLSWSKKKRELHSKDFVQISIPTGMHMRGKGFDAAEDFNWWRFKEKIEGEFPNFESMVGISDDE